MLKRSLLVGKSNDPVALATHHLTVGAVSAFGSYFYGFLRYTGFGMPTFGSLTPLTAVDGRNIGGITFQSANSAAYLYDQNTSYNVSGVYYIVRLDTLIGTTKVGTGARLSKPLFTSADVGQTIPILLDTLPVKTTFDWERV